MAKLSAYGRKEVVRLQKEYVPTSDLVSLRKHTVALMSDNHILEKADVVFKPAPYEDKPNKHSYGWKDAGKTTYTREAFVARWEKFGYTVVQGKL